MPKLSIEDQLLATLEYLREYRTYAHIAASYGIAESIKMCCEGENIWRTQEMMAEPYGADVRTIDHHIEKAFEDPALEEGSVIEPRALIRSELLSDRKNTVAF